MRPVTNRERKVLERWAAETRIALAELKEAWPERQAILEGIQPRPTNIAWPAGVISHPRIIHLYLRHASALYEQHERSLAAASPHLAEELLIDGLVDYAPDLVAYFAGGVPRGYEPANDYVVGGGLVEDATRWAEDPADVYASPPRRCETTAFAARLPAPDRAAFEHLIRLLDARRLPCWNHFRLREFGLDLCDGSHAWRIDPGPAPAGLRFLDDPAEVDRSRSVFPLATNGSFVLYVLVDDGRVAEVSTECSGVLGNWFVSLDTYLWAMVRLSATPKHLTRQQTIVLLASVEGAEDYVSGLLEVDD